MSTNNHEQNNKDHLEKPVEEKNLRTSSPYGKKNLSPSPKSSPTLKERPRTTEKLKTVPTFKNKRVLSAKTSRENEKKPLNSSSSRGSEKEKIFKPTHKVNRKLPVISQGKQTSKMSSKIGKVLNKIDFQNCDPETCLSVLKIPNLKTFSALNKKLTTSEKAWIEDFLSLGGLEILLETVESFTKNIHHLSDALILLECVACIKSLMNSHLGLQFITENFQYTKKLIKVLQSPNVMVKKQVFNLLSALCLSSKKGFTSCLTALDFFKEFSKQRYRFSFIIIELKKNDENYSTSILSFINCLLRGNDQLMERVKIRNELNGLNIKESLSKLQGKENEDLQTQLEVFEDEKNSDDKELSIRSQTRVTDFTDPRSIFDIISNRVFNSPVDSFLLNILSALLQLGVDDESVSKWQLIEKMILKIINNDNEKFLNFLEIFNYKKNIKKINKIIQTDPPLLPVDDSPINTNKEEFKKVLEKCLSGPDDHKLEKKNFKNKEKEEEICSSGPVLSSSSSSSSSSFSSLPLQLSPSPLLSSNLPNLTKNIFSNQSNNSIYQPTEISLPTFSNQFPLPPPPPPPPFPNFSSLFTIPPPPPPFPPYSSLPIPPPPPPMFPIATEICKKSTINQTGSKNPSHIITQISVPQPKNKMKTVNWVKINPNTAYKKDAIWSEVMEIEGPDQVDYGKLEELFSRKKIEEVENKKFEKKKESRVISLLDMKRSMNINIWLKQFKFPLEKVIHSIDVSELELFDEEKIKSLIKIMPDKNEIEMLNNFTGDKNILDSAEKFLIQLTSLPHYQLKLELLLHQLEFPQTHPLLSQKQSAFLDLCRGLRHSESLKQFFRFILQLGNFLNSGSYAGNAVGIKLSSLPKLKDTQANQKGVTLLHHLVSKAPIYYPSSLEFVKELEETLKICSKLSMDVLIAEINKLDKMSESLEKKLKECEDTEMQNKHFPFIQELKEKITELKERQEELNKKSLEICQHFCEEEQKFKLEELADLFYNFVLKIEECIKDNERRKKMQEKMEKRKKEIKNNNLKSNKTSSLKSFDSSECLVDKLLEEIRKGTTLRRVESDDFHSK